MVARSAAERRGGVRRFGICRHGDRWETPSEGLVAVGARVRAGVVDPVQDDEGHAAAHDQEAAQQEGGSLQGGTRVRGLRLPSNS